ncbi:DUF1559 domain-containing protein [Neorhodopirellula lusitana]|nr:DUF1559 domain-containing protein [Neorhodopirellula lusitana]
MQSQRARSTQRNAFTVLELLVTISIIGILMALLLPALGAAREASRRVQCTSHLHQIGVAMHNHHDVRRSLPAGWTFKPTAESAYGWAVPLLPFLEQPGLFSQIDVKKPIEDPSHDLARRTSLDMMLCPSDISEPTFMLYEGDEDEDDGHLATTAAIASDPPVALVELPTANYVGTFGTLEADDSVPAPLGDGAFLENKVTRFRDFSRGLTHTLLVGERTMAQVPSTWLGISLQGEDAAARIVGSALEGINNPFADEADHSSRHPGGVNFLWGDGHVSFVSNSVDLREYHQWSQLRIIR